MGEADRRGDGEDHGRDQARHHAEAEQDQRRDQVDEGRDRLHQVEERADRRVEPRPVGGGDADRDADRPRETSVAQSTSASVSQRRLPVAEIDDQEQAERRRRRRARSSGAGTRCRRRGARSAPAAGTTRGTASRPSMIEPSTSDDEVEEALGVAVEEVDDRLQPGAERDLVLRDPVFHARPRSRRRGGRAPPRRAFMHIRARGSS